MFFALTKYVIVFVAGCAGLLYVIVRPKPVIRSKNLIQVLILKLSLETENIYFFHFHFTLFSPYEFPFYIFDTNNFIHYNFLSPNFCD